MADFHRAQSRNKVGETLHSMFVQDLGLEQTRNKVSQEWNIIGTLLEQIVNWNRLGTDWEQKWNRFGTNWELLFQLCSGPTFYRSTVL